MKISRDGVDLHIAVDGPDTAPALVFAGSLGTTLDLWSPLLDLLPAGLRIVRYDMRGHGASGAPPAPYSMGQLVSDAEAVCDALAIRDCLFVGLSVGGMVGQALAVKRPEIIRAMVLSNTAAKIGHAKLWQDRIDAVNRHGLAPLADDILRRWFGRDFRDSPAAARYRDMLLATPVQGYTGVCAAIAGTDLLTPTSGLRIPVLGIAGAEDAATPPDLVRETIDLIPGAQFALMRRAGHLPCVEDPAAYAALLGEFIRNTGHV